jgi:hypothetical protein
MIPVLWFVKRYTIDPEVAKYIGFVIRLKVIGYYLFVSITLLGIVLLGCPLLQRILTRNQGHLKKR